MTTTHHPGLKLYSKFAPPVAPPSTKLTMESSDHAQNTNAQVIVVGAGPVGLLTSLRLGQAGVETIVIEAHHTLLNTTRALAYMPVVLPVLRKLGILDTVLSQAYLNNEGITWRDIDGELLARLPLSSSDPSSPGNILLLGQWRMNAIILETIKRYPSVKVRFSQKLTSLNDDPSNSSVTLTTIDPKDPESPPTQYSARYVVGADGANSTTRRLLDIAFEGFTYDDLPMIGVDVAYDFARHESFTPMNFVVHPTDWAAIIHTGQDATDNPYDPSNPPAAPQTTNTTTSSDECSRPPPMWRMCWPEAPNQPTDPSSISTRARAQIPKYIQSSEPWTLLRAEPYKMHQRHASPAYKNRVFLAGDALHTNNPMGGLGLTSGILDAFCFGNALIRVVRNSEPESLLVSCAEHRVDTWKQVTNKLSQTNLERMYAEDETEAGKARAGFFAKLNGVERDDVALGMRNGMSKLMVEDFARGTERWTDRKK